MAALFLHLRRYGYWVVFVGTLLEGEIVMLSAGVLAYVGVLNIWWVIIVGTVGAVLGDNFWFWAGRRGGVPFVHRYGGYVGLSHAHVERARVFLEKRGSQTIIISRFVYGTKIVSALMAGALGMSAARFYRANLAGSVAWATVTVLIGYAFANSFSVVRHYVLGGELLLLILVVLVVIITVLFISSTKRRKDNVNE